jgi:tetratricopeptide (TPR) repeat protein
VASLKTSDDLARVAEALEILKQPKVALRAEEEALLLLENYECWTPYFQYIDKKLGSEDRTIRDYVNKARIQSLYLEDVKAAAITCGKLIVDMKISYQEFAGYVSEMVEKENFAVESAILGAVAGRFASVQDQIQCLERLCLIYEKKYYDDEMLNRMQAKLINLHPSNMKALRYFKMLYSQNHEWEKVADILERLLSSARHPGDKAKIALELASINLYQLDVPTTAISLIEEYCQTNTLDTTTVAYDAFVRLDNLEAAAKTLGKSLEKIEDRRKRAIVCLKMGELYKNLKDWDAALQAFEMAYQSYPLFIESLEGITEVHLAQKNWDGVSKILELLLSTVEDDSLKVKVQQCYARLESVLVR